MSKLKRPVSEKKLAANRANAKKSTGPRTELGKAISSKNAITHGFTAKDHTALGEDYTAFLTTRDNFFESLQPRNAFEAGLAERLASLQVRLQRCVRQETGLLDMEIPDVKKTDTPETCNSASGEAFEKRQDTLMKLSRYESQLSRQFDQALKQYTAIRKVNFEPLNETKPTFVEKKDREVGEEATFRFQLDPPMEPVEAINRRIGKYIPPPEPKKRTEVMVWVDKNGSEWMRTDNKPLKMHDGTYLPDMRTYIDSKKYNPVWVTPEERAKMYAPPIAA